MRRLLQLTPFLILFSCSKPTDEIFELEGELCFRNEYASSFKEIVRVKANGANYTVVVHDSLSPALNIGNETIRWSHDKSKIVFNSSRGRSNTGARDVFTVNPDGSNLVNITNTPEIDDYGFGLSPNGEKLLFRKADENGAGQLYLSDVNGSNVRQLTSFSSPTRSLTIGNAIWCYDGRTIIFVSNKDGEYYQIYSIQADGTGLKQITTSNRSVEQCSITKDGRKLSFKTIFKSQGNYLSRIYTINADGTDEKMVLQTPLAFSPAISPDGKYIAFIGDKTKVTNYDGSDIYVIKADGTDLKRITHSAGSKFDLDWK